MVLADFNPCPAIYTLPRAVTLACSKIRAKRAVNKTNMQWLMVNTSNASLMKCERTSIFRLLQYSEFFLKKLL